MAAGEIFVPSGIASVADGIVWDATRSRPDHIARPASGLIDDFLRLGKGTDADILKFAVRWGPLYLCDHDLPVGHNLLGTTPCSLVPAGRRRGLVSESFAAWRSTSTRFMAALQVAVRLHATQPGFRTDWITLAGRWPHKRQPSIEGQWHRLLSLLNTWIRWGRVRPELVHGPARTRPVFDLAFAGVFGALTLQVAAVVARSDGFAFCSACTDLFTPTRRPVAYQRRYCPTCRKRGAPVRDAMADRRARLKTGGS